MKAIKFFAMTAMAAAVFASCSNDEDLAQSSYPADNVVRVTTNVEDITTRAFHTTKSLKEFAFCIGNANNNKYSYNNIKMTKEETQWNPSDPSVQMLWQNATQPVDIMAYAPFDSNGNTETMIKVQKYPVSVGTQQMAGTYESDFLVYKKTGFVPEKDLTNGAVDITFTHALSLLNIKIEFGTDFNTTTPLAANPINNINIGGSINKGFADLSADPITVAVDATCAPVLIEPELGEFTAAANNDAHAIANYSAILIPQTITEGFRVEFEINGKIYVWRAPKNVTATLEAGKKHLLPLTVGKDFVKAGSMTASPWVEGTGATLETE